MFGQQWNLKKGDHTMKRHVRKQMKLSEVISTVAQFARNDHEVGIVVADMICRGLVRVHVHQPRRRRMYK
jgi:phage terminase large subunit-like protein